MGKILFVNACIRPHSRTLELAKLVLERLEGEVEEVNLEREQIPPHDWPRLQKRDALLASGAFKDPMFRYARQFRDADTLVIAAPYYDLSFPSSLKNYLESICNVGLTFYYDAQEIPRTLCRIKRMIYVSTSGADFLPDYGYGYVKRLLGEFFEVTDTRCYYAERLDLAGSDPEAILARAKEIIAKDSF